MQLSLPCAATWSAAPRAETERCHSKRQPSPHRLFSQIGCKVHLSLHVLRCAIFRMMAEEGGECPVQAQAAAVASSTGQELSPRANAKGKRRSDKKEQSCKLRYVFIFPHYRCVYQDVRRKRPPKRLSQRPNDIYVNRNSDFSGQLARSHKLLDQGYSLYSHPYTAVAHFYSYLRAPLCNRAQELFIHGLGAAIHRAINLALQLKETSSHSLEVRTYVSHQDSP